MDGPLFAPGFIVTLCRFEHMNIKKPFHGGGWPIKFPVKSKSIVEVSEYRKQRTVKLAGTQLNQSFTARDQKRIVDEWVDLFSNGCPIRKLGVFTRMPQRLFDAVCDGGQIEQLHVKWGQLTICRESPISKT